MVPLYLFLPTLFAWCWDDRCFVIIEAWTITNSVIVYYWRLKMVAQSLAIFLESAFDEAYLFTFLSIWWWWLICCCYWRLRMIVPSLVFFNSAYGRYYSTTTSWWWPNTLDTGINSWRSSLNILNIPMNIVLKK